MLLASGVTQIIHAIKSKQWGTGFWGTVIGLLGVVAGLMMIFRPLVGLVAMTMLLAIYFLVDGVSEIVAAFRIRPDQGWGWVLFNGIIAVVLGFMVWRQWPVSGAWAIGILVGIHILLTGWTMIILGTGARRIAGTLEDVVEDTVDAAGDVAEKAADIAEDAVEKAKGMADDAADKAENLVDDVVDKAKGCLTGDKD
jgi:uncharacterized membrane protein HdeD (DUF308 family)